MSGTLSGRWWSFNALPAARLHALLKLRQDVFVVEQECAFAEIDGRDPDALHYLLWDEKSDALAGALRLFAFPGDSMAARIGRVVVSSGHRNLGLGRKLMGEGMAKARQTQPNCAIDLSAQAHLEAFYSSLGFVTVSEPYLEDGIPHIDMRSTV